MTTIDRSGNIHRGAGAPGAGRFDGRVNVAPTSGLLAAPENQKEARELVIGGESLSMISAAQARRELPVGQRVQVVYLGGHRKDDDGTPIIRTVAKQTPYDMTTLDGNGRGVHLDWAHKSARQDANGSIIVLDTDGIPIVAYVPIGDDSEAIHSPTIDLKVSRDYAEAKMTEDPRALERLANHRASGVQLAVAKNPKSPADALTLIAQTSGDNERTLQAVAEHPNTGSSTMDMLAESNHRSVRYAAASSVKTDPHTLIGLARDGDSGVRSAAAQNPNTPTALLDQMAGDRDPYVRQCVASNPRTSPEVLDRLANSSGYCMAEVGANTSTSPETLRRLADDTSTGNQTRAMVASNPAAPRDIIARSVRDADDWVREHAAKNTNLTVDEIAALASDASSRVRRAVASNPRAADATALADDPDPFVRHAFAKNPALPATILERLAGDELHAVRTAVARNPNTPESVLRRLRG
ncbi:hypothetical protein [Microbacterium gorillae]|uniref:variant leucine-rich repeat-containing protein n=1 Tax=Microbacterium gorillae TaxID=1231063 RepID=UPI003D98342D